MAHWNANKENIQRVRRSQFDGNSWDVTITLVISCSYLVNEECVLFSQESPLVAHCVLPKTRYHIDVHERGCKSYHMHLTRSGRSWQMNLVGQFLD